MPWRPRCAWERVRAARKDCFFKRPHGDPLIPHLSGATWMMVGIPCYEYPSRLSLLLQHPLSAEEAVKPLRPGIQQAARLFLSKAKAVTNHRVNTQFGRHTCV